MLVDSDPVTPLVNTNNAISMHYQVSLLRERNKILSLQNENLLCRVQQLEKILSKTQLNENKYQTQKGIIKENQLKERIQIANLLKVIQKNLLFQQNNSAQLIKQMIKNSCSTASIISSVAQLVLQIDNKQNQNNGKKNNLNRLQKLVEKRREKLNLIQSKNKQIVHLVKQPTWKQNSWEQSDLQFIVQSAEKLSRKIKKSQISIQKISNFFDEISNYIKLRITLRKQEKQLKIKQREMQLGVGCRLVFEQLAERTLNLNAEQLNKKRIIQQKILQI